MSASIKKLLVCSVAVAFAVTAASRPAQSGNGFATGAIIGGIAGVAIGSMIAGSKTFRYNRPAKSAAAQQQDNVSAVQRALNTFGFDAGPVTGRMNNQTKAAITRYQTKLGEPATGKLTDDQTNALLTAYAKRNQDNTAPTRVSKIDSLFAAIGVDPATAAPAPGGPDSFGKPSGGSAVPSFGGGAAAPAEPSANMRTICRDDLMTATLRESAADIFKTVRLVPDQFCVARSNVLVDASEAYKKMSKQPNAPKPDMVRTECQRFAEAKQPDIAKLASDPPANFARALITPATKPAERDAAIAASKVCLGFGYADDKADVVLASALVMVGFGETAYAELVGANLALGIGVTKDVSLAASWLEFTATEIEAGAPPMVKSDGTTRGKVLRQVVKELQGGGTAVAVIPAKLDSSVVVPNLFAPGGSTPPAKSGPSVAAADPKIDTPSARTGPAPKVGRMSRSDVVDKLRENVVMIYDGNGMGSGFFISPTHILTNTHVVADTSKVIVVNKSTRVQPALVRYRGMTKDGVGIDAAIIEVINYRHPTFMTFATDLKEGEDIAIAGFPYRALQMDRGFKQFLDLIDRNQLPTTSQIPNTKFAFGVVQSVFTDAKTGLENVQEGVETTGGNSGSPLVNECGEVVALHYSGLVGQVKVSGNQATVDTSKYNFAISFREVVKFLRDAGLTYQNAGGPCRN